MALGFGRKKADDNAPASLAPTSETEAAPVAAHAPSSPMGDDVDAFDFDSFADLPTVDSSAANTAPDADPIGDLGADQQNIHSDLSGSAFDFPEVAAPEVTAPEVTAPEIVAPQNFESEAITVSASEPAALDFDALFQDEQANAAAQNAKIAAPAPFVPPSALIEEPAAPFYEPQILADAEVESETESPIQPKKKLPLVPILGALGFLALAGVGANYFANQSAPPTEETAPAPIAATAPVAPAKAPASPPTSLPTKVVQIKPVPVRIKLLPAGKNPVNPGIAPASAQSSQLKALWKRGADAKHRGDLAAALRYWNQGLKIQPNNAGFKESIAKVKVRQVRR